MTQTEFLKRIGLSKVDFRDLNTKFVAFQQSLNKAQLASVHRSMPTMSRVRRSLGGDLTTQQFTDIVLKIQGDDLSNGGQFDGHTSPLSAQNNSDSNTQ